MRRSLLALSGFLILTASSSGTELALVNADTPSPVSITLGAGYTSDYVESYLALETDLAGFSIGVMACHDASDGYGYDMYWECFAQYVMDLGSLSLGLSATSGYFDDSVEYCALSVFLDIPVSDRINLSTHFTTTFSEDLGDHTFVGIGIGFGLQDPYRSRGYR